MNAARNTPAEQPQPYSKVFELNLTMPTGAMIYDELGVATATLSSEGLDPRDLDRDGMITVLDASFQASLQISSEIIV